MWRRTSGLKLLDVSNLDLHFEKRRSSGILFCCLTIGDIDNGWFPSHTHTFVVTWLRFNAQIRGDRWESWFVFGNWWHWQWLVCHRRPCFADWQVLCSSVTPSQTRLDHFIVWKGSLFWLFTHSWLTDPLFITHTESNHAWPFYTQMVTSSTVFCHHTLSRASIVCPF